MCTILYKYTGLGLLRHAKELKGMANCIVSPELLVDHLEFQMDCLVCCVCTGLLGTFLLLSLK